MDVPDVEDKWHVAESLTEGRRLERDGLLVRRRVIVQLDRAGGDEYELLARVRGPEQHGARLGRALLQQGREAVDEARGAAAEDRRRLDHRAVCVRRDFDLQFHGQTFEDRLDRDGRERRGRKALLQV